MPVLPTGIVTFLFTDIEGSTRIAQRLGPNFRGVVEDHNAILRAAIEKHGGITVSTSGDSVFAVFTDADDAVLAALDSQRNLHSHDWPDGGLILVRMGVHTGEGRAGGENYVGVDVITAARISAAAHGGQIIVSEATRSRIDPLDTTIVDWRDVGVHNLKGLDEPWHLYQVVSSGLPVEFPPLGTEGPPTNLPAQDSLFVGREAEANEVRDLLSRERLVTLYGPGGIGKTRLAVHVAGQVVRDFEGGVHLVRLTTTNDPIRVAPALVEVIGASQIGDPVGAVVERIGSKPWLLVLDGFEQLTASAPMLTTLLEACGQLTLLVTSQRLLRTRFERVYAVPPLEVPGDSSLATVRASEGASLFVGRAASLDPSFILDEENASDVADIVTGLDGLPLAIELAAARVRLVGLAGLRTELQESISVLSGGFAGDEARHRSMEAAITWSYGLLDRSAQSLFSRCSWFAGGFTLDAMEVVCRDEPVTSVPDALAQLLDSSLVTSMTSAGNVRFRMLEPLRKFGMKRMEGAGEEATVSRRHAEHYIALVSQAAASMHGPGHYSAMERLSSEQLNLATAMEWSIDNDPDMGLKILLDLSYSLPVVGALADGLHLAMRLLGAGGSPSARVSGLLGAGAIAYWLNDYGAAETRYREAIELSEVLSDALRLAEALYGQAFSLVWLGRLDEAVRVADRIEDTLDEPNTRMSRGISTLRAFVEWMRGNTDAAATRFEEVIASSRESGNEGEELFNRLALSGIAVLRGQTELAIPVQFRALQRFAELQDEGGMVHALDWLAQSVIAVSPREGLVVAGAVDALRGRRGGFIDLTRLGMADPRAAAAKTVSENEIESRWSEGRELDLTETARLATEWAQRHGVAAASI